MRKTEFPIRCLITEVEGNQAWRSPKGGEEEEEGETWDTDHL